MVCVKDVFEMRGVNLKAHNLQHKICSTTCTGQKKTAKYCCTLNVMQKIMQLRFLTKILQCRVGSKANGEKGPNLIWRRVLAGVNIVMRHFLGGVRIAMRRFLAGFNIVMRHFLAGVHISMRHFLGGVILFPINTC